MYDCVKQVCYYIRNHIGMIHIYGCVSTLPLHTFFLMVYLLDSQTHRINAKTVFTRSSLLTGRTKGKHNERTSLMDTYYVLLSLAKCKQVFIHSSSLFLVCTKIQQQHVFP